MLDTLILILDLDTCYIQIRLSSISTLESLLRTTSQEFDCLDTTDLTGLLIFLGWIQVFHFAQIVEM